MSASRGELEASIEHERQELRDAVQDFQIVSLQTVSPSHWVSERPYLVVIGAFAVGFFLGLRRQALLRHSHPPVAEESDHERADTDRNGSLRDVTLRKIVEDDVPSIWGAFKLPAGDRVRFAFLHPRPPQIAQDSDERDAELVLVAREVAGHEGPLIVAGDFNDVAWSYTMKLFQKLSGLLDPRIGRGFYSTFHAHYPPLRWPRDHAFHSEHLALVELRRLGGSKSDHFPILLELAVVPSAASEQEAPEAEAGDREQAEEIIDEGARIPFNRPAAADSPRRS